MKYALSAARMKSADKNTIAHFGVASLVLQERAALAVCAQIGTDDVKKPEKGVVTGSVRIYAGCGNNGADALACARILSRRGYHTEIRIVGNPDRATAEFHAQLRSVNAYDLRVSDFEEEVSSGAREAVPEYVIDGLTGVGISRPAEGAMAKAIHEINALHEAGSRVIAVDLPSGIDADTGMVRGCAVCADKTVTFGFAKTGQLLYPGAFHCGALTVADIGIDESSLCFGKGEELEVIPNAFYFDDLNLPSLVPRRADGNKGTFGKVLLVTGSRDTGGAAILASRAAFAAGCGMVRVFTAHEMREAVLSAVPEALLGVYDTNALETDDAAREVVLAKLREALAWADAVVCGCGTGTGSAAYLLLQTVLEEADTPLVLDADALNLLSAHASLREKVKHYTSGARTGKKQPVLTPHAGEFARLFGAVRGEDTGVNDCKENALVYPSLLAGELDAIVVYKDARSIVTAGEGSVYINISGNDGMATAGSGDVLAGMLGALLARYGYADAFLQVCNGTYLHGLAGDLAAEKAGKSALTASDLVEAAGSVLRKTETHGADAGFLRNM